MPILAEQNVEDTFTLPTEIATDASSFVLEVHGDSMINVGIFNGDYLVVREQKNAMNGEIVVAMIDNEATVKTFYKERGRVRLQPENDAMEPIYAENPDPGQSGRPHEALLGADVQDNAHEDNPRKPRIAFFDSLRGSHPIIDGRVHTAYGTRPYLYQFEIPGSQTPSSDGLALLDKLGVSRPCRMDDEPFAQQLKGAVSVTSCRGRIPCHQHRWG